MRLILPIRTKSEANMREHFAQKAKRVAAQRAQALAILTAGLHLPALPCVVTLTRISPSSRGLDTDNLAGAFKAIRDGIADWLGVDDGDKRVHYLYAQEQGAPKTHQVRVEIIERSIVRTIIEAA